MSDAEIDVTLARTRAWEAYLVEFPEDRDNHAARTAFSFGWWKGVEFVPADEVERLRAAVLEEVTDRIDEARGPGVVSVERAIVRAMLAGDGQSG